MRERPGGTLRTDEPALDLLASKLLRPLVRPGTVRRSALVERLAAGGPQRIVSVVAPPGYGKTTLVSQWTERNGQAFAWVSVDEADNDPKILLTYVAEARSRTSGGWALSASSTRYPAAVPISSGGNRLGEHGPPPAGPRRQASRSARQTGAQP